MTFYNLPGVDAKIEFDAKARVLVISGLSASDRILFNPGELETVTVYIDER